MNYFLVAALVPLVVLVQYLTEMFQYARTQVPELLASFLTLAGLVVSHWAFPFAALFIFRYLRLIVHLISFWCFYKPTPVPAQPTITPKDVSVILPTVDPENQDFKECLESTLTNYPGEIIIVTVGRTMAALTNQIVAPYRARFPNTHIQVHFTAVANKRIQVAHGIRFATGKVSVLLDDHVFWPSQNFLVTILAPFENDKVGAVGTNKRVRRTDTGFNIRSFWNMIGALYLERHNFEIRATNAVDGGVFVISGRTAAYRTEILKSPGFLDGFANEMFFFGKFGPLNADDDNYLTRQVVARGYDIKIQYCKDAMIETTLGTYPKFLSQCLRWVRTTWRSNSASLFTDRTVWYRQPWCVYAVYLTSFVNFALFYDAALVYTLSRIADRTAVYALIAWIFATKMVKLTPYFLREPQDLLMLPGYFAFAYFHSLVKLYAGLTFWVTAWGGRNLDAINQGGSDDNDGDDDDDKSYHPSSSSSTSRPASASSSSSGATPRPPPTRTPWGSVSGRVNPFLTPANALDSQLLTAPRNRHTFPQAFRASSLFTPNSLTRNLGPASAVYDSDVINVNDSASASPAPAPALALAPVAQLLTPTQSSQSSWLPAVHTPFRLDQTSNPNLTSLLTPPATVRTPNAKPTDPFTFAADTNTNTNKRASSPLPLPVRVNVNVDMQYTSARPSSYMYGMARERKGLGIPDAYTKTWARGKQCRCLHSDGDLLFKTRSCRCLVT